MLLLGFALASMIGVSLGLLGGGGSILTVPVFVYLLGFAAKPAIAMSLPVVGMTSLIGAAVHWRLGNVRLGTALMFGPAAMVGAYAGAKLAVYVSGAAQLAILAIVMLVAAVLMLRRGKRDGATAPRPARPMLVVPIALGTGIMTGLVGIGGGFLVVPTLVLVAGVEMRQAVGTSLLVIAMNSASGFAGYLGTVPIDWGFLAGFTAIAVVGALAGIALSRRVPQARLKQAFAVFLIVVGAFVLHRNRAVFRPGHAASEEVVGAASPESILQD